MGKDRLLQRSVLCIVAYFIISLNSTHVVSGKPLSAHSGSEICLNVARSYLGSKITTEKHVGVVSVEVPCTENGCSTGQELKGVQGVRFLSLPPTFSV